MELLLLLARYMYMTFFQSDVTSLSSNFEFIDEESGLDHYKIQIYQHHEGVRSQVIPGM